MLFSTQIKTIFISSLVFVSASFAAAPAPINRVEMPFSATEECVLIDCPKIDAHEATIRLLIEVVEKIKKGTLNQDDAMLTSLLNNQLSVRECDCDWFHRANGMRKKIENTVIDLLDVPSVNKANPLAYVNFSAGLLFQDLIIVTKLIEAGYQDITMYLVDSYYDTFCDWIDQVYCIGARDLAYGSFGQDKCAQVNNAIVGLAHYVGLLKNIKNARVKIVIIDSTKKALKVIKPQSCQLILCVDFGLPPELENIDFDCMMTNPFSNPYQSPIFHKSYTGNPCVEQDYFRLARHVLKNGGYNCALTVQNAQEDSRYFKERKINCAKQCILEGLPFYLYTKNNEPGFGLVVDSKYGFTIDPQTNKIQMLDCKKPAGKFLDNPSIKDAEKFEFLRPTLEQGDNLSVESIRRLKDLVK